MRIVKTERTAFARCEIGLMSVFAICIAAVGLAIVIGIVAAAAGLFIGFYLLYHIANWAFSRFQQLLFSASQRLLCFWCC